jgi:Xaa-Pro aminopeptidase
MSSAPTAGLRRRHDAIRSAFDTHRVDAVVITALPNVLYLTNFTGSSAIVVLAADRLYFLTDSRYTTVMNETRGLAYECPGLELVAIEGSYDAKLADVLSGQGWTRVAFEAVDLTVSRHAWLTSKLAAAAPAVDFVPTEGLVERARLIKDDYEIATLREAGRRLSRVAAQVPSEVRAGRTETEVAMAIDSRIREAGFSRTAFETIVAGGPNAALPHARPGERKLAEGDLVVLDFGGVYDSYCVDLTRTVSIGPASPRAREVYEAVRDAHDRAIQAVAPGRSRFDIDAAARQTLDERGLGEAFGHGTGHGLGIEVHEGPRITRRRPDVDTADEAVQAGMVFTIEPGAYLPGWGGVRIEDDVLVTENGVDLLTTTPTDLIEI